MNIYTKSTRTSGRLFELIFVDDTETLAEYLMEKVERDKIKAPEKYGTEDYGFIAALLG